MEKDNIILHNAHIIDPAQEMDEIATIYIKDGLIEKIVKESATSDNAHDNSSHPNNETEYQQIDLQGKYVLPPLAAANVRMNNIDEDSFSSLENLAIQGGITHVIVSPQNISNFETPEMIELFCNRAKDRKVQFYILAPLTKQHSEQDFSEIGLMSKAGAVGFDTGDFQITDPSVMVKVLSYIKDFNTLACITPQDKHLTTYGNPNDSLPATLLGLAPNNELAELVALERDIRIANFTNVNYHINQVTCANSLAVIKQHKAEGKKLTAGVSIDHLCFNELDLIDYNTKLKLSMPLRSEKDRQSLISALKNGTLDIISSNHVSYNTAKKRTSFAEAPVGTANLDIMLPAALRLYHDGALSLSRLVELLSTNPAKIFNLKIEKLQAGNRANMVVLDKDKMWQFKPSSDISHAYGSSPFYGLYDVIMDGKFITSNLEHELK